MELIEVYRVRSKRRQGSLELLLHIRGAPELFTLERRRVAMAELCGKDPARTVCLDGQAHELLREMVPVTLGGVDQGDPVLPRSLE